MNFLFPDSFPGSGIFRIVLVVIFMAAYAALTIGFVLAFRSLLRSIDLEKTVVKWIRVGFLLLSVALIVHSTWTTFAWGEYWAWDPAKNAGVLAWLMFAGVLHMHHVPELRGRRVLFASLAAWSLFTLTLAAMMLFTTTPELGNSGRFGP